MKTRHFIWSLLLTAILFTSTAYADGPGFGKRTLFNDGWRFALIDDTQASQPEYNDSSWRALDLPHDWSIEGRLSPDMASCQGYLPGGIGWYRRTFEITDDYPIHYIYLEGVYNRSQIFLNGKLIGNRPNGYASQLYDLTPYLQPGKNVLAIRVDHSRQADSRWYTGSGIYRDTYLISAPESHFALWGVGYQATLDKSGKKANVLVDVQIEKPQKGMIVQATIYDKDGKKVTASQSKVTSQNKYTLPLTIKNPTLWDIDNPYLYTLDVALMEGKNTIDQDITPIGIRTLQFDPNTGFSLNGVNRKVKGVCLHHDAGVLGAVVPRDVWKRRLQALKDMGANAVRMSHNPQAPVVYDLCDELGLLVMDEGSDEWEFPKRKWIKGWNQGEPGYEGTADFFEEWIDRDVADMVRRDRNHPSIFLWSVGNEVDYPNDPYSHPILDGAEINQPMYGGYKPDAPKAERIGQIAKRLATVIRSIDTSRPITGAMAGVIMSNETEYPDAIDICGYNYTEDRYAEDHAKYPDRIIYGSENGHGYKQWRAVEDNDYIFGQFIWTGTDYLGESGAWPSRGLNTGLLNFGSFLKPRGHFRKSLWSETPACYVGAYPMPNGMHRRRNPEHEYVSIDAPHNWSDYDEGQSMRVVCYTNGKSADLYINDELLGSQEKNDYNGIIYFDIPFQPGEIKTVARDADGNEIARDSICTTGRPYALTAEIDGEFTQAPGGVNHLLIKVVDENGLQVNLADNNITCKVEGPAVLLGLDGSDNRDMGDYNDNVQRAYQGELLAYLQNGKENGEVTITITSPLLKKKIFKYSLGNNQ